VGHRREPRRLRREHRPVRAAAPVSPAYPRVPESARECPRVPESTPELIASCGCAGARHLSRPTDSCHR
jgi:hypothetical protein